MGEKTKKLWENPEYKKMMSEAHKGTSTNENNGNWKGDNASKDAMHKWIIVRKGFAKQCEQCGKKGKKALVEDGIYTLGK